jgi:hypothetical protein
VGDVIAQQSASGKQMVGQRHHRGNVERMAWSNAATAASPMY